MKTKLETLVKEEGMAAVLATLRNILNDQAETEEEADAAKLETMGSKLLEIAAEYQELVTGVAV